MPAAAARKRGRPPLPETRIGDARLALALAEERIKTSTREFILIVNDELRALRELRADLEGIEGAAA